MLTTLAGTALISLSGAVLISLSTHKTICSNAFSSPYPAQATHQGDKPDYVSTEGTLSFDANETEKWFKVRAPYHNSILLSLSCPHKYVCGVHCALHACLPLPYRPSCLLPLPYRSSCMPASHLSSRSTTHPLFFSVPFQPFHSYFPPSFCCCFNSLPSLHFSALCPLFKKQCTYNVRTLTLTTCS